MKCTALHFHISFVGSQKYYNNQKRPKLHDNKMVNKNIKIGNLCFATYPINKTQGHETDLYYCIPLEIGFELSRCVLFFGSDVEKLRYKGTFSDVFTSDLTPL